MLCVSWLVTSLGVALGESNLNGIPAAIGNESHQLEHEIWSNQSETLLLIQYIIYYVYIYV